MSAGGYGYECDPVKEQPAFQWQCRICHCILREPYQVSCCGFSFCKVCIEQAQAKKRECPLCNNTSHTIFHDKGLERLLNQLGVYCTHKGRGCEWEGELRGLGQHLNSPDNRLAGCKFENIACNLCTKIFQRNCLQSHKSECPERPFSCQYCRQYNSTYVNVTQNHWYRCASYPLQCRNCEKVVQRQHLECHINRDCPNTCITCDFHFVGCQAQLARKDMPSHIRENISGHMHQLQQHLATQPVANHVMYVPLLVGSMQTTVIDNIDTRSRLIEAEKSLRESQETISRQKTELENLHKELRQSQQHFTQMERQLTLQLTKQGEKQEGFDGELKQVKSSFKRESDSSVEKINELESTLTAQGQTLHRLSSSVTLPITFTISEAKKGMRRNEEVVTMPFYTHPHGYRLCTQIRLNDASRRYISVYFCLMKGLFDDALAWPFQGEIKFELVNQLWDMQHYQCTVDFAECQDSQIINRVIRGPGRSGWFGIPEFIAHSQLAVRRMQYLKDDQLQFRIVEVLNIQPVHVIM